MVMLCGDCVNWKPWTPGDKIGAGTCSRWSHGVKVKSLRNGMDYSCDMEEEEAKRIEKKGW